MADATPTAIRRLVRRNGSLQVIYLDALTGQEIPISQLGKYEVLSANTGKQTYDPQTGEFSQGNIMYPLTGDLNGSGQGGNATSGESTPTNSGSKTNSFGVGQSDQGTGLGDLPAGNLLGGIANAMGVGGDYTSTLPGQTNSELTKPSGGIGGVSSGSSTPVQRADQIIGSTPAQNRADQTSQNNDPVTSFLNDRDSRQSGFVGVNADQLNPEFATRMTALISAAEQATGSKVSITEGERSASTQAQYYANYIQKPVTYEGVTYRPKKVGGIAAAPGLSEHQLGAAMDISTNSPAYSWMVQHASEFGIEAGAKWGGSQNDPPHFELPSSEFNQLKSGKPIKELGAKLLQQYAPQLASQENGLAMTQTPDTLGTGHPANTQQVITPNSSGSPDDRQAANTTVSAIANVLQNMKNSVGDTTPISKPSWWDQSMSASVEPSVEQGSPTSWWNQANGGSFKANTVNQDNSKIDQAGTTQMPANVTPNVPQISGDGESLQLLGNPNFAAQVSNASAIPSSYQQTAPALGHVGTDTKVADLLANAKNNTVQPPKEDAAYMDALVQTINKAEGSPAYNELFGGKPIVLNAADHPNIKVPYNNGQSWSTAAGYGQFTNATWNDINSKYFNGQLNFSSEQDQQAAMVKLAEVRYNAATGRDLVSDLKSGDTSAIQNVFSNLSGTWASLPGGQQPQTTMTDIMNNYNSYLKQFQMANTTAAQISQPSLMNGGAFASPDIQPYKVGTAFAGNAVGATEASSGIAGLNDVGTGVSGVNTSGFSSPIGSKASTQTGGISGLPIVASGVSSPKNNSGTNTGGTGIAASPVVSSVGSSVSNNGGTGGNAGGQGTGGTGFNASSPTNTSVGSGVAGTQVSSSTPIGSASNKSTGGIAGVSGGSGVASSNTGSAYKLNGWGSSAF